MRLVLSMGGFFTRWLVNTLTARSSIHGCHVSHSYWARMKGTGANNILFVPVPCRASINKNVTQGKGRSSRQRPPLPSRLYEHGHVRLASPFHSCLVGGRVWFEPSSPSLDFSFFWLVLTKHGCHVSHSYWARMKGTGANNILSWNCWRGLWWPRTAIRKFAYFWIFFSVSAFFMYRFCIFFHLLLFLPI